MSDTLNKIFVETSGTISFATMKLLEGSLYLGVVPGAPSAPCFRQTDTYGEGDGSEDGSWIFTIPGDRHGCEAIATYFTDFFGMGHMYCGRDVPYPSVLNLAFIVDVTTAQGNAGRIGLAQGHYTDGPERVSNWWIASQNLSIVKGACFISFGTQNTHVTAKGTHQFNITGL